YPAPAELSPLSLHDALPISRGSTSACFPPTHERSTRPQEAPVNRPRFVRVVAALAAAAAILSASPGHAAPSAPVGPQYDATATRSEEHTSELQSRSDLVCRL